MNPLSRHTWCLLLLALTVCLLPGKALGEEREPLVQPDDSIRVSLLTCDSGVHIWTLFGHSALRVQIPAKRIDWVFNYGMFNFAAPHFVLRFALGQTDYHLGVERYKYFAPDYRERGRSIWEQELNLTHEEKLRLLDALEENYLPENREYRYNFLYDNCATRPRDKVEQAIDGTLHYAADMATTDTDITLRDVILHYCQGHPWSRLGMNLCLGSKADRPLNRRTLMFVPFVLQDYWREAKVVNARGEVRPLVTEERTVVDTGQTAADRYDHSPSPTACATVLLAIIVVLTIIEVRRKRSWWVIDALILTAAGLAGCLLTFLALLSEHPCMSPNFMLLLLHPLHLLAMPCVVIRIARGRLSRYMAVMGVIFTLFILFMPIFPQKFDPAVVPLALCLLTRCVGHVWLRATPLRRK